MFMFGAGAEFVRSEMTKRKYILAALVIVVIGGALWIMLRPREPVYQGKSLTAWLEQDVVNYLIAYQQPLPGSEAEAAKRNRAREEAEVAIRHIGTNALPYLLKMVAVKDSALKEKLITLLSKQSLVSIPFRDARECHYMAVCGFAALRSEATPAVPSLIDLLHSPATNRIMVNVPNDAAVCLAMIGETSVPYLLPLLTNGDPDVRFYASSAARSIVPRLTYLVSSDNNETNRCRMIGELAEIGWPDPDMWKALTNALSDKSFLVRNAATNALKRIDPAAAGKAGVK
jgi:hypothetical protein